MNLLSFLSACHLISIVLLLGFVVLASHTKNHLFFNSELASVKAHDREVTQQAKYAQDEVI